MFFRKYVPSYVMTFRMSFKKFYDEYTVWQIFSLLQLATERIRRWCLTL